jgi:hypothetical protein
MHVQTVGTRAQVWHGTAKKTSGGLTKNNLMKNKAGRIVSKAKHNTAKKEMRLVKYGYGTKKGEFGMVKIGSRKRMSRKNKSRKMKGGYMAFSPANVNDSYMIKDVVPQEFGPQERALVGGRRRSKSRSMGMGMGKGMSKGMSMGRSMGRSMGKGMSKGKSMGKSMGKGMGMTGGTGFRALSPSDLGSDDVQFMAGNAA